MHAIGALVGGGADPGSVVVQAERQAQNPVVGVRLVMAEPEGGKLLLGNGPAGSMMRSAGRLSTGSAVVNRLRCRRRVSTLTAFGLAVAVRAWSRLFLRLHDLVDVSYETVALAETGALQEAVANITGSAVAGLAAAAAGFGLALL